MRKVGLLLGVLGVLVMCMGGAAYGEVERGVTVSANVLPVIRLTVSPDKVDFGSMDPENPSRTVALGATVSSNRYWELTVTKDGDLYNEEENYSIPSSQLTFSVTSSDQRVTSTGSGEFGTGPNGTLVAAGRRGGNIGLTVNYRLVITWDDPPGQYSATHTYTAMQP